MVDYTLPPREPSAFEVAMYKTAYLAWLSNKNNPAPWDVVTTHRGVYLMPGSEDFNMRFEYRAALDNMLKKRADLDPPSYAIETDYAELKLRLAEVEAKLDKERERTAQLMDVLLRHFGWTVDPEKLKELAEKHGVEDAG